MIMDAHRWTFEWEKGTQACSLGWAIAGTDGDALLHPSELARMHGFSSPVRRNGFRLGRIAAKRALSAWLSPAQCASTLIGSGAFGQPVLSAPFDVSLSHSESTAVAVASPSGFPMGIDIEFLSDEPSRIRALEGQMTEGEQTLGKLHFPSRSALLHGLWSAKEALSKVLRTGLGTPFSVLEISEISSHEGIRLLNFRHFFPYSVVQITGPDKVISLCFPSQGKVDWPAALAPLRERL